MTPGNLPAGIQSGAAKADRTVSGESNLYPVTPKETALFGAQCGGVISITYYMRLTQETNP